VQGKGQGRRYPLRYVTREREKALFKRRGGTENPFGPSTKEMLFLAGKDWKGRNRLLGKQETNLQRDEEFPKVRLRGGWWD